MPQPYPNGTATFAITRPNVHGTTEADDLWASLVQYQRTGQPGFLVRAWEWARYFRDDYRQCRSNGAVQSKGSPDYERTYCYDQTLWKADGSGTGGYANDHMYGWGLLAWYQYLLAQQDLTAKSYLDAAVLLGEDVESYYSHAKFVPGFAIGSSPGPRAGGRHLLLISRLAQVTGDPRWHTLLAKLVMLWLAAPDWNTAYGTYFLSAGTTDAYFPVGSHASGVRLVSAFMNGILHEGLYGAWTTTPPGAQKDALRARLVAMARFTQQYARDPASSYAGYTFGVNVATGARIQYNTYPGLSTTTTPPNWNPAYTLDQVNTLVHGYQFTGDEALLDEARRCLFCGTHGAYGTTQPCPATMASVGHFLDTTFDGQNSDNMPGQTYFGGNKAELFYASEILRNGGNPPLLP